MRFSIDGMVQKDWIEASLSDVLRFLKTNTYKFKNKEDEKIINDFLYSRKLLKDQYLIKEGIVMLKKPIKNKENLVKFNMTVKNKVPFIEDGYSFILIDLDLKNLNLKPNEGINRDDLIKNITEHMLLSFDTAYNNSPFKEGLVYAKTSFSKKGLHLLYRVNATTDMKDLKIAGFEIGRRIEDEFKLDLFKTNVFDTAVFGDNWNGYFNYVDKDSYYINEYLTVLDISNLDEKRKDSNIKSFNQLNGYRDGRLRNLHCNPDRIDIFKKKKTIANIWNSFCGDMSNTYVTGNNNRLYMCEIKMKNSGYEKDEFISWISDNKPELIDSKTMFGENGKKTIREHIEYNWERIYVYETDSEPKDDLKDSSIFIQGKLNKTLFESYIYSSGFHRLILRDKGEVKESVLVYKEGPLLNRVDSKNLLVSDYWIDFMNKINVHDSHQRTTINNYINGNLNVIDLPLLEYDDILIDDKDHCYIFTIDGVVEVTKDSHKLLVDNDKPYFRKSIATEWYKINAPTNYIKYDPTLDISNWKEKSIFEFIHDEPIKLKKITGYLIHRYKDENYNIALLDSFDGKDGGGTGKSLVSYLTSPVRNVSIIERPKTKDPFWLANYDISSDIMLLNECPRDFDIETLRPTRDMSMTVERKGVDRKNLGVMTPRTILNSNYMILSDKYADKRRISVVVFNKTIKQEDMINYFGHKWFFQKQTTEWWSKYLLFMIECVQEYLKDTNISYEIDEYLLQKRKLDEIHEFDSKSDVCEYIVSYIMNNIGRFLNISDIKRELEINDNITNAKIYKYIKLHIDVNKMPLEFEQCISEDKERKRGFIVKRKIKDTFGIFTK